MNRLLPATVGAATMFFASVTTNTVVTAQTNENIVGADVWDDIEGVLQDICEVCGCAWARNPQALGIAADAEAVVLSYQANGVLPEATSAQRLDAKSAIPVVRRWVLEHPGAMSPDLEARLLETLESVNRDL